MPAHSTAIISTLFALFWLTDLCYPFISDRQVHLTLIFLLLLDLSTRLLSPRDNEPLNSSEQPSSHPDNEQFPDSIDEFHTKNQTLRRDNESLIKENAALSITIKNMSDKHTLLCEIRSTLNRQRRDSKELITLMLDTTDRKSSAESFSLSKARHTLRVGSRSEGCILLSAASV